MNPSLKSSLIRICIDLVLAFTCIISAMELTLSPAWHNALLIIGGLFLGVFCADFTLLRIAYKKHQKAKEVIEANKKD